MTRGRARRYLLVKQGYYPQVVADAGYTVFDWSTLNAGTLFQDSAKTTPVASNSDPVGAWVDGVQGVDAIQATTANKPTYVTGSLGGLPTLGFDGGDLLATGNIEIGTFAVWCVVKYTSGSIIYEQSVDSDSTNGMMVISTGWRVRRSTNYSRYNGTIAASGQTKIFRHENQGTHATHKLFANNSPVSGTTGNSGDTGTATATQPLFIGGRSGIVFPFTGNIAHLCIVSPYPTPAIIANMESYINGIWGVY